MLSFFECLFISRADMYSHEPGNGDAGLRPEECLFIDDLEENVAAARQLGITGMVHPPGSDLVERLQAFLD